MTTHTYVKSLRSTVTEQRIELLTFNRSGVSSNSSKGSRSHIKDEI